MRRALRLARRGQGFVEPNPMVGCVLVKNDRIIAEGYHHYFGGPHAEVDALRRAGNRTRGTVAYVTLEPCNYFGKTPPCTEALIRAEVSEVFAATKDPNPRVAGKGLSQLRRAGIKTHVGLLQSEAIQLNAPYLKRCTQKLPYVIAKWAQSIDGKIATHTGDSKWISCESSRRMVHELRSRVDAVLVGIGTILKDDPMLNCRDGAPRRIATRVILDTHLRTPMSALVVQTANKWPTLIFTSPKYSRSPKAKQLRSRFVQVESVRPTSEGIPLRQVLRRLYERGMTNVLIEGGGKVLGYAFDEHLIDEIHVFIAPKLIGGRAAISPLSGRGILRIRNASILKSVEIRRVGPDLYYHAYLR